MLISETHLTYKYNFDIKGFIFTKHSEGKVPGGSSKIASKALYSRKLSFQLPESKFYSHKKMTTELTLSSIFLKWKSSKPTVGSCLTTSFYFTYSAGLPFWYYITEQDQLSSSSWEVPLSLAYCGSPSLAFPPPSKVFQRLACDRYSNILLWQLCSQRQFLPPPCV